jgi:hypothetical protein
MRVIKYTTKDGTVTLFRSLKPLFAKFNDLMLKKSKINTALSRKKTEYKDENCTIERVNVE